MKPSLRLLAVSLLCLVCAFNSEAKGRRTKFKIPPPPYIAIESVDSAAMTITTAPRNSTAIASKTYKLTPKTKVTVNGHDATLAELQAGMQVRIGAGMDANIATEVSASDAPIPAKEEK